jgi:hypothetical protein
MAKNIIIGLLLIAVVWLSSTVIRLENYRYASFLGMCPIEESQGIKSTADHYACLNLIETRTNSIWHLFYALTDE